MTPPKGGYGQGVLYLWAKFWAMSALLIEDYEMFATSLWSLQSGINEIEAVANRLVGLTEILATWRECTA